MGEYGFLLEQVTRERDEARAEVERLTEQIRRWEEWKPRGGVFLSREDADAIEKALAAVELPVSPGAIQYDARTARRLSGLTRDALARLRAARERTA